MKLNVTIEQLRAAIWTIEMSIECFDPSDMNFFCPNQMRILADNAALYARWTEYFEVIEEEGNGSISTGGGEPIHLEMSKHEADTFYRMLVLETRSNRTDWDEYSPSILRIWACQVELLDLLSEVQE